MAEALTDEILEFWFGTTRLDEELDYREAWFKRDDDFDDAIRTRFAGAVEDALAGRLDAMAGDAPGALALLILLDQFTRNLFRGTARAFEGDAKALAIARQALAQSFDKAMGQRQRIFVYLPFEHSENLADQERSVALFAPLADPRAHDYAMRHRDVIARFGRFPHRNEAIGRPSTAAEIEFLKTPGSSF